MGFFIVLNYDEYLPIKERHYIMRICKICGIGKHPTEFYKHDNGKDIRNICKNCSLLRSKQWYVNHKEIVGARRIRDRFQKPEMFLLKRARIRAKKMNLPFNITLADIHIPTHCPVLGIPLQLGIGTRVDGSPSLDRINNDLGYTQGNIMVISDRANMIKNAGTSAEHRLIADYLDRHSTPESIVIPSSTSL